MRSSRPRRRRSSPTPNVVHARCRPARAESYFEARRPRDPWAGGAAEGADVADRLAAAPSPRIVSGDTEHGVVAFEHPVRPLVEAIVKVVNIAAPDLASMTFSAPARRWRPPQPDAPAAEATRGRLAAERSAADPA
jgi:hypothetical protein